VGALFCFSRFVVLLPESECNEQRKEKNKKQKGIDRVARKLERRREGEPAFRVF